MGDAPITSQVRYGFRHSWRRSPGFRTCEYCGIPRELVTAGPRGGSVYRYQLPGGVVDERGVSEPPPPCRRSYTPSTE